MDLYRVTIEVSPAVEHPLFWEWKTGSLLMWIYATSPENAGERAGEIVACLPYEAADKAQVVLASDVRPVAAEFPTATEYEKWGASRAKEVGLALLLHSLPLEAENIPEAAADGPQGL